MFAIPSYLQGHVRVPDNDIDHAEEDESAAHTVVGANILDPIDAALDQPPELVADTDSDDEEPAGWAARRTARGA